MSAGEGQPGRRPALEPGFLEADEEMAALADEEVPGFLSSRPPPPPQEAPGRDPTEVVAATTGEVAAVPGDRGPDEPDDDAWAAFADAEAPPGEPSEVAPPEKPHEPGRRGRRVGRRRGGAEVETTGAAESAEHGVEGPPDTAETVLGSQEAQAAAADLPPALQLDPDPRLLPPGPGDPAAGRREEPPSRPTAALEIEPHPPAPPLAPQPTPTPGPPPPQPAPPPPSAATSVPPPPPSAGPETPPAPPDTTETVARWRSGAAEYEDHGWEEISAEFRALREEEERDDAALSVTPSAGPPTGVADEAPAEEEGREAERAAALEAGRNVAIAVATGLVLGLVALGLITAGRPWFMALVTTVIVLALVEFYTGLRHARFQPAAAPGLLGALVMLLGTYSQGPEALGFGLAMVLVFTLLWFQLGVIRAHPVANLGATLLGVLYVAFLGSFAVQILAFPDWAGITIGYLALAVANDVGGYVAGSRLGRTFFAPRVSPHKSLEGLLGGGVLAVAVAVAVIRTIHPFDVKSAVGLALIITVAAPLGDLLESAMKRAVGVKDLGSLLPGHGGVIDRIDSILVVLPAAYLFTRLVLY